MESFIDLIKSVPGVVWGALVASVISLGGNIYAKYDDRKRLRLEFEHEARQKELDRKLESRRDVYFDVVSEAAKAVGAFGALIDGKKIADISTAWTDFNTSVMKLQLVAEPATALLADSFIVACGEIYLQSFVQALPIQMLEQELELQSVGFDRSLKESTRSSDEITRLRERGELTDELYRELRRTGDRASEAMEQFLSDGGLVRRKLEKEKIAFLRESLENTKVIGRLRNPVIIALRGDLGFTTTHESDLERQLDSGFKRIEVQLERMIHKLEEMSTSID